MSDQENPTPPDVKVIICQKRLANQTAAEIAEQLGMNVLLVQEVLRVAGWPSRTKTAGYAAQLSGGVLRPAGPRDDSVQTLCAACQKVGTQRARTLAERITRTQAEIVALVKDDAKHRAERDKAARRRAKEAAIKAQKKALREQRRKLKADSDSISEQIAELDRQLHEEDAS